MRIRIVSGITIALALAISNAPSQAATSPLLEISTDRSAYSPSQQVSFTAKTRAVKGLKLSVTYFSLSNPIKAQSITADQDGSTTWTWSPPTTNYRGYLVRVILKQGSKELITRTIGVDVSSDWGMFPRYGFLSKFSTQNYNTQYSVIEKLTRFHINGLQFYDWQDRHDSPLTIVEGAPLAQWNDIANRTTYLATVGNYITLAHSRGMKAMNYNLIMGAYNDYIDSGISPEWGVYTDTNHTTQDGYELPEDWESGLKLFNPANANWQAYIIAKQSQVYTYLSFDGWHVDQLGNRDVFDYNGNRVDLAAGYASLLNYAKNTMPGEFVMNAVDNYAQQEILGTNSTKFAYAELWNGNESFASIQQTIESNWASSARRPNTVLAAYINRSMSSDPGGFNAPGVLMADAAIFAAGGAHIELGEHILSNEYFPNSNLHASSSLMTTLTGYYDFAVAYENLLRGKVRPYSLNVAIRSHDVSRDDAAAAGTIWSFARRTSDSKIRILHLLNLENSNSDLWRDDYADMPPPKLLKNLSVRFKQTTKVKKIWTASPDINGGTPQSLKFTQKNGYVTVTLPNLKYWGMLVIQ